MAQASSNFYSSIKSFDLSKLWLPDRQMDGSANAIDDEPIGFIGNNFQRFYIHYTSIVKDASNPYKYIAKGKTRVKNNICSFSGTIIIKTADIFKDSEDPRYKEGMVECLIDLREEESQSGSGQIKGKLVTQWCLDKNHHIFYDNLQSEADGFNNNECEATWTSYQTNKSKKCNWGDNRIPASGDLDIGAGEFMVNEKYLNNGWENYSMSLSNNKPGYKAAVIEENRKWWK